MDQDNYCRKISMTVLKHNLQVMGTEELYKGFISKVEFEGLWTTFFDLYDTLESFGSHLTKVSLFFHKYCFRLSGTELKFFSLTLDNITPT